MKMQSKLALAAMMVGMGVGSANAGIVITEIFYNLSGPEGANVEWIEIANNGPTAVDLTGFVARDIADNSANAVIPAGTTLASGGVAVITQQSAVTFQLIWGSGINVITVPAFFSLANTGAAPTGAIPATPGPVADFPAALFGGGTGETPAIVDLTAGVVHDVVPYNNVAPWPTNAEVTLPGTGTNGGRTIYLKPSALADAVNADELNNDGANWAASNVGVDGAYTAAILNPDYADNATSFRTFDVASPGVVTGLTIIVPEPAALGLLAPVAAMALGRRRR